MKRPAIIALIFILFGALVFKLFPFTSGIGKGKIMITQELELRCASDSWNQFVKCTRGRHFDEQKNEFKIPVTTLDNFKHYELVLSHNSYGTKIEESTRLGEGKFKLIDATKHFVCGTYEGYVDQTNDRDDVLLFLKIEGGSGQYKGMRGFLSAACVPDPENPSNRNLSLKGKIKKMERQNIEAMACL